MPGYSGTPLPRKLGLKPAQQVALLGAEADFADLLEPLPAGVTLHERLAARAKYDLILLFAPSQAALRKSLAPAVARLKPDGALWLCWLKKASGRPTDLGEKDVHEQGLATGLVDIKVCAVTDDWSGLKFVVRVRDQKGGRRE